ncbi:MAG TPA: hypothetical protein VKD67_06000, partial [Acidimicrobiales bacterium]|nr:hypothetical protein [Acidimicrobiales bacterium]
WAPRGHTPVLCHRFGWKRLSMAAALAYASDGTDARLVFQTRPGACNDESLITFLDAVPRRAGRSQGHADLGRTALASQPADARLPRPPAPLARRLPSSSSPSSAPT